jgi:cytochrome c biogenesis protein CcmG/thiol:disulfide interchange protein DsbE
VSPLRRRLLFGVPLVIAVGGGDAFYILLRRMQAQNYDPHALPSPLIGKRPPPFALPGAAGMQGFANTDIAAPAKPMLVNWFASWCVPCAEEAAMLDALALKGLSIWGIAYEDDAHGIAQYLSSNGNPYQRIAADAQGTTAINWGVYGVPETYFIDRAGIVRWRYAGALTQDVVSAHLDPLLEQYS